MADIVFICLIHAVVLLNMTNTMTSRSDTFMKRHKINVVVITAALSNDERFRSDPAFLQFIQQPDQSGFEKVETIDPSLAQNFRHKSLIKKE